MRKQEIKQIDKIELSKNVEELEEQIMRLDNNCYKLQEYHKSLKTVCDIWVCCCYCTQISHFIHQHNRETG